MEAIKQQEKMKFNLGIVLYTAFTICIVISDYLQYLFSANYWLSLAIAVIGIGAICFLLRKKMHDQPHQALQGRCDRYFRNTVFKRYKNRYSRK